MRFRARFAAAFAAVSTVLLLPAAAQAQQVTGLEVRQADGFATLSWDPVADATEYERAPVKLGDTLPPSSRMAAMDARMPRRENWVAAY